MCSIMWWKEVNSEQRSGNAGQYGWHARARTSVDNAETVVLCPGRRSGAPVLAAQTLGFLAER